VYTSLSGQLAAFKHLEVIANNLANMNTTGFRAERVLFEKALTQEHMKMGGSAFKSDVSQPSELKVHEYVGIKGSFTDFGQGSIETTGDPLHMAIQGPGFFALQTPDGERYTRAGNFRLDDTNRLVNQEGFAVQGSNGDIIIPNNANEIQITDEGDILVDKNSVGRIRVVDIDNGLLQRESRMLFKPTEGAVVADVANFTVRSRALEGSNVNAVRELTDMIMASRVYDSFTKTNEANSRMNEMRNQRVGSTQG
jgi:flagellar basal-body rod protein FlgF